jgi:hypothetical protein
MKYRNPRNNHTFQIERRPRLWLIVERGWDGKIFCIIDRYDREEDANREISRLAQFMKWEEA